MQLTLSEKIIEAAKKLLDEGNATTFPTEVSVADELVAILSDNPDDMLAALHEMKRNGKTFYLGLPR